MVTIFLDNLGGLKLPQTNLYLHVNLYESQISTDRNVLGDELRGLKTSK